MNVKSAVEVLNIIIIIICIYMLGGQTICFIILLINCNRKVTISEFMLATKQRNFAFQAARCLCLSANTHGKFSYHDTFNVILYKIAYAMGTTRSVLMRKLIAVRFGVWLVYMDKV